MNKNTRFYVRLARQAARRARRLKQLHAFGAAESEYRIVAVLLRIARSTVGKKVSLGAAVETMNG